MPGTRRQLVPVLNQVALSFWRCWSPRASLESIFSLLPAWGQVLHSPFPLCQCAYIYHPLAALGIYSKLEKGYNSHVTILSKIRVNHIKIILKAKWVSGSSSEEAVVWTGKQVFSGKPDFHFFNCDTRINSQPTTSGQCGDRVMSHTWKCSGKSRALPRDRASGNLFLDSRGRQRQDGAEY